MNAIVIGCSGYIGQKLVERLASNPAVTRLYLVDRVTPSYALPLKATFHEVDLRQRFAFPDAVSAVDWCFHLAAACREPGFSTEEYYDHNFRGTENLLNALDGIRCRRVVFTSTMAVYGPTEKPTDETYPPSPISAYGASKLLAEGLLTAWQQQGANRRVVICRPAVIYGPNDVQNVPRMVRAVRKGWFAIPAGREVKKAVGYVHGLLDSMQFALAQPDTLIIYNYAERDCLSVGQMGQMIRREFNVRVPVWRIPFGFVYGAACVASVLSAGKSPIHPTRVKKLVTSCELVPRYLLDAGFDFRWSFEKSLKHWREVSPGDFS